MNMKFGLNNNHVTQFKNMSVGDFPQSVHSRHAGLPYIASGVQFDLLHISQL